MKTKKRRKKFVRYIKFGVTSEVQRALKRIYPNVSPGADENWEINMVLFEALSAYADYYANTGRLEIPTGRLDVVPGPSHWQGSTGKGAFGGMTLEFVLTMLPVEQIAQLRRIWRAEFDCSTRGLENTPLENYRPSMFDGFTGGQTGDESDDEGDEWKKGGKAS